MTEVEKSGRKCAGFEPLLSEIFSQIFYRFVNFVSRYGGVLSQFVNLTAPEDHELLAFTYLEKIRKIWKGKVAQKKPGKSGNL